MIGSVVSHMSLSVLGRVMGFGTKSFKLGSIDLKRSANTYKSQGLGVGFV